MNEVRLQDKYQLFIDGEWRDATDGKTIASVNPANGEKLAECADATKEDVDAAVAAAAERSEERRVGKERRSRWSPYH